MVHSWVLRISGAPWHMSTDWRDLACYTSVAYNRRMIFVETPIYTKEILKLLPSDADHRAIQLALLFRPESGEILRHTGGLRKLRWNLPHAGRRGGLRVIYYWDKPDEVLYMLWVYRKSRQDELTHRQCKLLSQLVKEYLA